MTTVRQLIESLKKENLDEPVVYEYYLKDHFQHLKVSDKVWAEIAEEHDSILTNDSAYDEIEEAIKQASA
jgi:hypothetical protein